MMFKLLLIFYMLVNLLIQINGETPKVQKQVKSGGIAKNVFDRGLVKTVVRPKTIVKNYHNFCHKKLDRRLHDGYTLGYITPWNKDGYVNSHHFCGKFTMLSPVWFRILGGETEIEGKDDVNYEWMDNIEDSACNTTVKILPRVLFQSWTDDFITDLYINLERRNKLVKSLSTFAKRYELDGYVLEIWNQFLAARVQKKIIIGIINHVASELSKKNLEIILAVPPQRGQTQEMFSKNDFNALAKHITAFSLMTYDYSSVQNPGPNAPYNWMKKCVEYLVPDASDPKRSKILLGLNFYGYFYSPQGGHAITGPDYIKRLEKFNGEIKWDDNTKEHFIEIRSSDNEEDNGFVFYPTLYSLKVRLDLAKELNVGISIWELGQGLNYFFDLL